MASFWHRAHHWIFFVLANSLLNSSTSTVTLLDDALLDFRRRFSTSVVNCSIFFSTIRRAFRSTSNSFFKFFMWTRCFMLRESSRVSKILAYLLSHSHLLPEAAFFAF